MIFGKKSSDSLAFGGRRCGPQIPDGRELSRLLRVRRALVLRCAAPYSPPFLPAPKPWRGWLGSRGKPAANVPLSRFVYARLSPAIAYSRVGTGIPSAVPSSSNFPASHSGLEHGLIAQSC